MKHLNLGVFSNCPEVGRATDPICGKLRAGVSGALCWECCSHSTLARSWGGCCGRCHHWCDYIFKMWFQVSLLCWSTYQLASVSFRRKPLLIALVGTVRPAVALFSSIVTSAPHFNSRREAIEDYCLKPRRIFSFHSFIQPCSLKQNYKTHHLTWKWEHHSLRGCGRASSGSGLCCWQQPWRSRVQGTITPGQVSGRGQGPPERLWARMTFIIMFSWLDHLTHPPNQPDLDWSVCHWQRTHSFNGCSLEPAVSSHLHITDQVATQLRGCLTDLLHTSWSLSILSQTVTIVNNVHLLSINVGLLHLISTHEAYQCVNILLHTISLG